MADRPVVAFDVSVLLELAGLDMGKGDTLPRGSGHQCAVSTGPLDQGLT